MAPRATPAAVLEVPVLLRAPNRGYEPPRPSFRAPRSSARTKPRVPAAGEHVQPAVVLVREPNGRYGPPTGPPDGRGTPGSARLFLSAHQVAARRVVDPAEPGLCTAHKNAPGAAAERARRRGPRRGRGHSAPCRGWHPLRYPVRRDLLDARARGHARASDRARARGHARASARASARAPDRA